MADPFIGQIAIFGFTFAPQGWALCQGQLLPLSQNLALFSILGTQYGGDGKSTFALPDLRGCAAIGAGQGPGLSPYNPGDTGGASTITLIEAEMPNHSHGFAASTDAATKAEPAGNLLASALRRLGLGAEAQAPGPTEVAANFYSPNPAKANAPLANGAIASAGGGQAHNNMQPSLALNFCIALKGAIPQRS
jgi:microcystin-dependent protein